MKIHAVTFLLLLVIVKNTTAYWKNDLAQKNYDYLSNIVASVTNEIYDQANARNTEEAQRCYDAGMSRLNSLIENGYEDISTCIQLESEHEIAQDCCEKVTSRFVEDATWISESTNNCFENA